MTVLLEQAVTKIHALPEEDQNALASLILNEVDSERKWDDLFASTQPQLAKMASLAIADYKPGKTTSLDIDRDL